MKKRNQTEAYGERKEIERKEKQVETSAEKWSMGNMRYINTTGV